ncbi:MAG: hypothetical protein NTY80_05150 [candidate division SR1 bacterium]|nr:hypothetical protein [candidate division SR1 bacterium]
MKKVSKKKVVIKKAVATKKTVTKTNSSWLGLLSVGNVLGLIAVLVVNYLAVSIPIGGISTGALSDLYPNLFVPAALTFSIWGLIYLLLIAFVIRQLVDFYKRKSTGITKKIGIWFLLSCAANVGRMFAWQYQQLVLSLLVIVFFLITLIVIAKRIEIGKKIGSLGDKYLVQVPFSIYLGRLCVATIANATALLVHFGWGMWGMSDIFWTNLMIVIAAVLALLSIKKTYNIMFALVVVWAFIGIIIKRVAVDPVYAHSIIWTLGSCITIIAYSIGANFEQRKKN